MLTASGTRQTELHRHGDVTARISTLLQLAQERGLESQSTSLESFREKVWLTRPLSDLNSVLDTFTLFQHVLDRPDVIEQVTYENILDIRAEGTLNVELRIAPAFLSQHTKLGWEDILEGFEAGIRRGLAQHPEMKAGLICIVNREPGAEFAHRIVEFFLKHRERFIGIDLAGSETDLATHLFAPAMKKARDAGARITIHAGEAGGPDDIWCAIDEMGAERVGHGIQCLRDPELVRVLAERKICLEMCPTSNWLTQCWPGDVSTHPLPRVLRAGIPVCINTDDPGIFGITLPSEVAICRERMEMSLDEIQQCFAHAEKASFL